MSQLNEALRIPGLSNAWTMPIKARIDMLTTGMQNPCGDQDIRRDLKVIEQIGARVEEASPRRKGNAERVRRANQRRLLH